MSRQILPPGTPEAVLQAMGALWQRYKHTTQGRLEVLERAVASSLAGELDEALRAEAEREAHKLTGSLGTFGFPQGSVLAREIEALLMRELRGPADVAQLERTVAALREELAQDLDEPLEIALTVPAASPAAAPAPRERLKLLVVDDDAELAERLALEASARGLSPLVALSVEAARGAIARERPDVVVLDLAFPGDPAAGLNLLSELARAEPPIRTLIHSARPPSEQRQAAAGRGASGYMQKPLPPAQVLDAVLEGA